MLSSLLCALALADRVTGLRTSGLNLIEHGEFEAALKQEGGATQASQAQAAAADTAAAAAAETRAAIRPAAVHHQSVQTAAVDDAAAMEASFAVAPGTHVNPLLPLEVPNASPSADGHMNWDKIAKEVNKPSNIWDILRYIGGGGGASISRAGDTREDVELLRRTGYQDRALVIFFLSAYLGMLAFSAAIAYRHAANNAPVDYYADPRQHVQTYQGNDVEDFMDAFNFAPKDVQLQVTGFNPSPLLGSDVDMLATGQRMGFRHNIAFSFGLDLSSWVVRQGGDPNLSTTGVSAEDVEKLREYLADDKNHLTYVELVKTVSWNGWEELATNIKAQIRQGGFQGQVLVRPIPQAEMHVHKNTQWANFLHGRALKAIVFLSVFLLPVYKAYMAWRHFPLTLRCDYKVRLKVDEYWPLIASRIGPNGFDNGVPESAPLGLRVPWQSVEQQRTQQQQAAQDFHQSSHG